MTRRRLTCGRWAAIREGNLYAGGGPGAKLYRLSAGGEKKMVAELDGLQIQAIAIDSHDRVYAATAPDGKVYRVGGGRQVRSLLRSQGEIHLGVGFR